MKFPWIFLLSLAVAPRVFACDVTLPAGSSASLINSTLASANVTCLAKGTYNLGSTTIAVPAGKTLAGATGIRTDVVLNSTATRAMSLANAASVQGLTLSGPGGQTGEYGILVYQANDTIIWGVAVKNFLINIGLVSSSRSHIWDSDVSLNGIPNDGTAQPNIWISNSPSTDLYYGSVTGRGDKPFGDGEVSCYNSPSLSVNGTQSFDSGTSAFYLVNCDNATVKNTKIYRAGGFGLDIVGGSDNFTASNNTIQWAWYAGSVFENSVNTGGSYQSNAFVSNNVSGDARFCTGIWLNTGYAAPALSGNTASPTALTCYH